jgi:sterol desaturase/sphingolipid hydroxylase (fatty acid hydroxylase superfamily)
MWRIHRVHHSPVQMDALSASRVHVFEGAIKYGLLVLPFRFLGVAESVMLTYTIIDMFKAFWHHANLRTHIGPLNHVLNSAELHWWHHAMEGPGQHSNYGSVLSIWDRLFGTFHWPRGQWPERIGVEGCERFPRTYREMFMTAFMSDQPARAKNGANPAECDVAEARETRPAADERDDAAIAQPAVEARCATLVAQPAAE